MFLVSNMASGASAVSMAGFRFFTPYSNASTLYVSFGARANGGSDTCALVGETVEKALKLNGNYR